MKKKVYIISIIGIVLDFLSKAFIMSKLSVGSSKTIIENFFYITHVNNKGAAWGIFSSNTMVLTIISILFTIFFVWYVEKNKLKLYEEISAGIILAGILGNMFDRIFRGYVVDFLNFYIFGYDYPVFNIADTFIVVGVLIIIVFSIKELLSKWKKD
jgi:signal peptidase II